MERYQQIQTVLKNRKNDFIKTYTEGHIRFIVYNRPQKSNAFTTDMFYNATQAIRSASQDSSIKFIVVYGEGKSFSTGNDLFNFSDPDFQDIPPIELIPYLGKIILENYALSIIACTKPIFAITHGYATGAGFTQLGLYDKVYAVDGAIFRAPLVKLAQGPEMGSSYTFPKFFGRNRSVEILVDGREMTAKELVRIGFAYPAQSVKDAMDKLREYLKTLDSMDFSSLMQCRNLIRRNHQKQLFEVNQFQCRNLVQRWLQPNLINYLLKYLSEEKQRSKGRL